MSASLPRIAILHYTAPPVIGGVESVMLAHARLLAARRYPISIIAGRGSEPAMPEGCGLVLVPEMDSQHPDILRASQELEAGVVPDSFDALVSRLAGKLGPLLGGFDVWMVHNIFGKHFNLPLTAALDRLLDRSPAPRLIAWGHDFSWTSPNSRSKVHPGYPWNLLRTPRPGVIYVAVSEQRRQELASLFEIPAGRIRLVYNGVSPTSVLGLSGQGAFLAERLGLLNSDLILLMPVRITQAKNIEFAIRCAAALKQAGCRLRLVVTGPPDPHDPANMAYFHSLLALRQELGLEQEVRFVYESGNDPSAGCIIDERTVGDLLRLSDLLFMPSHREGFGMPVLEAGLAGVPVFTTPIPASIEIGRQDVVVFAASQEPAAIARQVLDWALGSPAHRLKRRVRRQYTWDAIFDAEIAPLLALPGAA